ILFGGRVLEIPFKLPESNSIPYNIQQSQWKSRTHNSFFDPHEQTLQEINSVYESYKFPENPLLNVEPPRRQRQPVEH
ncbi:SET domain-containing protein, partial [Aphis craccivora]